MTAPAPQPYGRTPPTDTAARAVEERNRRATKLLDAEFLAKLLAVGRPARLSDLFGGLTPVWAANTAARVVSQGLADRDRDGRYTLTDAGRTSLGTRG